MQKTKFDLLVERIISVTEGRKPKTYPKMVIDFNKLEQDINNLSDTNPFKGFYSATLNGLKQYGENEYFTNEEMSQEAKTVPEWEEAIYAALSGKSLSKFEKKTLAERFFNYVKDPDREYLSEYAPEVEGEKHVESVAEHIYDFITQSDEESATVKEIVTYIGRYGHEESEVKEIIQKMIKNGELVDNDGKLTAVKDPSLDELEPSDLELGGTPEIDDLEAFRADESEDEEPDSGRIPDDVAKELGIDPNDPFGDLSFDEDNLNSDRE